MLTFENRHGPAQADAPDYPSPVVPQWWRDAKLGLFVHWGLYSLPAFACRPGPRANDADAYARHTYAEWYANTVRIQGSPTQIEHARRYGDASYEDLAELWRARHFDAQALVEDARRWGARYLIPTTKHHDGFCLWNTATTGFSTARRGPRRDLIAEIADACARTDLRFGCYFSGALDWHLSAFAPITDNHELFQFRRNDREFATYAATQLRELIHRFHPSVLWNDIDWPDAGKASGPDDLAALFAEYRGVVPDGVINDRWGVPHRGHLTREYIDVPGIIAEPWEATRGLGHSFGLSLEETDDDRLDGADAVRLLVDVVAKGGNLLLNVGPDASGVIPAEQRATMDYLGEWLGRYGSSIYGTRPWSRHGEPDQSFAYTSTSDTLYVHVLHPDQARLSVPDLDVDLWRARWVTGGDVQIDGEVLVVPERLRGEPVTVLAVPRSA